MSAVAAVVFDRERSTVQPESLVLADLPAGVSLGLNSASQETQARERGIQAIGQKGCYCQACYLAVADLLSVARQGDFHSALGTDKDHHASALRRMANAPDAPEHRRALRGYRFLWLNG